MHDEIEVHIPGHPVGKGRARSFVRSYKDGNPIIGHVTPKETRTWEGIARTHASIAMRGRPPISGPVRVAILIMHAIPEGWPAWKRAMALDGQIEPTVKPDADNVEKAVKDAFNGVVWVDDCQVTAGVKLKKYGEHPGVRVTINARPAHPAQLKRRPEVSNA